VIEEVAFNLSTNKGDANGVGTGTRDARGFRRRGFDE